MTLHQSDRIKKNPLALVWRDAGHIETSVPLETALMRIARNVHKPQYEPLFHRLEKIAWDDGSWSWASPWVSAHNGQTTIYIKSACGSPMVVAHFSNSEIL